MAEVAEVLDRGARCVLGFAGRRGPILSPMAYWYDGAALWMSTPAVSVKAKTLRARSECAVYVPPVDGTATGAVLTGTARVFGLHDPIGLATHGPVVSAAMTMLATRNAGTILGYVQDVTAVPARFRPRNRVVVRIGIGDGRPVRVPSPAAGIAPGLPLAVDPTVRRALAGQRSVVLAAEQPGGRLWIGPAVWGAGFSLALPAGEVLAPGSPAAVHLGTDPHNRPTAVVGLSLFGDIADERLRPTRATWWEGFDLTTVELPAAAPSLALPD